MPDPINCNEQEARAFLGLTENAFTVWRQRGWIVPVMQGLYNYDQLRAATELALEHRRKGNVINLERDEEGQTVRSKGDRHHRTPPEFLRSNA